MSKVLNDLKSGKINGAWVAAKLYPQIPLKTAVAKFHNKLNNVQNRSFTDVELKQIEIILK